MWSLLLWLEWFYNATIWPIVLITMLAGLWRNDWQLIRCAVVAASGQAALDIWVAHYWTPDAHQPGAQLVLIYSAQLFAVTILPTSRTCWRLGGVFFAGLFISLIYLAAGPSHATDKLYWSNNLMVALASIIVLSGGAAGENGKRVLDYLGGRIAHLFHRSTAARTT